MTDTSSPSLRAAAVLARAGELKDEMVAFVRQLAVLESPTDHPRTQAPVQALLSDALEALGYRVRRIPGQRSGGHLWARRHQRRRGAPLQLLVGHTDTVWPVGTLASMPVEVEGDVLRGPGTFDMKGGLAQIVFALRIVQELGLEPPAEPVLLINSDEETGSPESRRWVARAARRACRAFVPEPALGPTGLLKTARRGIAHYRVQVRGRAAHSGLDPEAGASAIEEMAHVVLALQALSDHPMGISVNVGVVHGGTRANVIADAAEALVDVRVLTHADWLRVDEQIREIRPTVEGTSVAITGGLVAPPMEKTPRNRALWHAAVDAAGRLGLEIGEATSGGGSDGNTTSLYTATLDGLGAVGDGAHANHEHLIISKMVERTALLVELLMAEVKP